MWALLQFACHDADLWLRSFCGQTALLSVLRKQPRCGFVFLPVSEAFSGSAAALSRGHREQRGARYSNSFRFQIRTMSFVDNPLKHEGCNLRVQGWKKKCPVDTCGYLSVNHTAGKKIGHLEKSCRCTLANRHKNVWASFHITKQASTHHWSHDLDKPAHKYENILNGQNSPMFKLYFGSSNQKVSRVNGILSQTQFQPKTESTKWHLWQSK